jgi:hypothetical protein
VEHAKSLADAELRSLIVIIELKENAISEQMRNFMKHQGLQDLDQQTPDSFEGVLGRHQFALWQYGKDSSEHTDGEVCSLAAAA